MMNFVMIIVKIIISFLVEKIFGTWFTPTSPVQKAVNTETKMAQEFANVPSQSQAIKDLDNDTV